MYYQKYIYIISEVSRVSQGCQSQLLPVRRPQHILPKMVIASARVLRRGTFPENGTDWEALLMGLWMHRRVIDQTVKVSEYNTDFPRFFVLF